ncbi:MAG TPA: histidine kinase, partial [Bacillota bacterium]|nr:histidine kinase [Bacillota bacterium]
MARKLIQRVNEHDLDFIINEMIDVVQKSKDEIFNISEEARRDYDQLKH